MTQVEKSWGFERVLHNADGYCMKLLVYHSPKASSLHFHRKKHETFYIADGHFTLELHTANGVQVLEMYPGNHVVIPPNTPHRLRFHKSALANVCGTVVEASSHDDPEDCVRLVPSDP